MKIKYLALIAFLATSCAPTIKNFDLYQKQFLSKTHFMPTEENLTNIAPKVVVFAFEENNNKIATQAVLGASIANNIENILSQNKLAELVDRNAGQKLKSEIKLAEMNKTGSYKGPKVADYAISGAISNAGFTSKYSNGSTFMNPANGRLISIPPKYKYFSQVSGNIKIYEMPSLTVIDTIEFSGKVTRSEGVRQNGGFSVGGLQIGGKKVDGSDRDDSLVRKAGEDGINNAKVRLQNAFAKKGYILEKRNYKKKSIFKITLGSSDGIKQGDTFTIIGKYEVENPITGNSEVERKIIASGVVSDLINHKHSWILIKDPKKINKIRLGDTVKIKYKKGSFDALIKFSKSAINL